MRPASSARVPFQRERGKHLSPPPGASSVRDLARGDRSASKAVRALPAQAGYIQALSVRCILFFFFSLSRPRIPRLVASDSRVPSSARLSSVAAVPRRANNTYVIYVTFIPDFGDVRSEENSLYTSGE